MCKGENALTWANASSFALSKAGGKQDEHGPEDHPNGRTRADGAARRGLFDAVTVVGAGASATAVVAGAALERLDPGVEFHGGGAGTVAAAFDNDGVADADQRIALDVSCVAFDGEGMAVDICVATWAHAVDHAIFGTIGNDDLFDAGGVRSVREIGRASCRERGWVSEVGVAVR